MKRKNTKSPFVVIKFDDKNPACPDVLLSDGAGQYWLENSLTLKRESVTIAEALKWYARTSTLCAGSTGSIAILAADAANELARLGAS